jgi:hypothetical protein
MIQQNFEPGAMTPRETDLLRTLRTHMRYENITEFTVDTLRMLGFDRFMPHDKLGRITYGSMIGKWQYEGYVERTGRTVCSQLESNHGHREQVWKMTEK